MGIPPFVSIPMPQAQIGLQWRKCVQIGGAAFGIMSSKKSGDSPQ
jgi:hypothetical protein